MRVTARPTRRQKIRLWRAVEETSEMRRCCQRKSRRARRIDKPPLRREALERGVEQHHLARVQFEQIGWLQLPANFRVARQRACAGTRRIHQNAVEFSAKGK